VLDVDDRVDDEVSGSDEVDVEKGVIDGDGAGV